MCGICGAVSTGPLTLTELKNVQKLAFLNIMRGQDQGGMMYQMRDDKVYYVKTDLPSLAFLKELSDYITEWNDAKEPNPIMISVHMRAATIGEVTEDNCHPFPVENICGMHNGTVRKGLDDMDKFGTDSEALFNVLGKKGLKAAIDQIASDYGAAALVWTDGNDDTINFWRNHNRPLHFINTGSTIYYSSDAKDLMYVFDKLTKENHTVLTTECGKEHTPRVNSIFQFDVYRHYKLKVGGSMSFTIDDATPEFPKAAVTYNYGNGYTGHYRDADFWDDYSEYTPPKPNRQLQPLSNVVPLPPVNTNKHPIFDSVPTKMKEISEMHAPEWERIGYTAFGSTPYSRTTFYAIEFDKFFTAYDYCRLQYWRAENPDKFLSQLRKVWNSADKLRQKDMCDRSGLSRNKVKKMLEFKNNNEQDSYIYHPYAVKQDGEVIYNNVLSRYYALPVATPKKEPIVLVGVSDRAVTESEFKQMISCGCVFCGNPVDKNEDIYWLTNNDFLCEKCQEDTVGSKADHMIRQCYNFDLKELEEKVQARYRRFSQSIINHRNIG